jgi:hypothetical protein
MRTATPAAPLPYHRLTPRVLLLVLASWMADSHAGPAPEAPPRQTEFNEHNYRPRQIVNRLPPPPRSAYQQPRPPQVRETTRSARWAWKDRETFERGTFQWRESDGRIDSGSVCMNETRGSLRYRSCRKGAKEAFAKLCRERRDPAACHAQNNYSALR